MKNVDYQQTNKYPLPFNIVFRHKLKCKGFQKSNRLQIELEAETKGISASLVFIARVVGLCFF